MFWMRAYPLLGQVGEGWALEISSFLGSKWHSPISSMLFHRAPKTLEFQGQPPPTCPCDGYARIKNIMHGAVKIIGA